MSVLKFSESLYLLHTSKLLNFPLGRRMLLFFPSRVWHSAVRSRVISVLDEWFCAFCIQWFTVLLILYTLSASRLWGPRPCSWRAFQGFINFIMPLVRRVISFCRVLATYICFVLHLYMISTGWRLLAYFGTSSRSFRCLIIWTAVCSTVNNFVRGVEQVPEQLLSPTMSCAIR